MAKRKSKCYTICYAILEGSDDMEPYTGTWFAYGRTKEEAKLPFCANVSTCMSSAGKSRQIVMLLSTL